MFIVTWMWLDHQLLPLPWMVFLNSFIHVLMYYYYLMTDLKIPVPWKRYMTTAQIVQLNLGFVLIAAWFYVKPRFNCVGDPVPIYIAAGANVILVGFFCNFYYKQYVKKKALREQQQKQQQQQAEKEKQQ